MTRKTTWILVADGGRARILKQSAPGGALHGAPDDAFEHEVVPAHEMGSERPGRVNERAGAGHHAIEPRVDWRREGKQQFAQKLAQLLETAAERNEFDRLILVAPPRVIGDLRASLGRHAKAKIAAEFEKDLTALNPQEIAERLAAAELI